MKRAAAYLTALVAIEHIGILVLEMSFWNHPVGQRIFGMTPEIAAGMLTLGAGFLFPTKKYTKPKPPKRSDSDVASDTSPLPVPLNPAQVSVSDIEFRQDGREAEKVPLGSVTEHTTRNLDQHPD